MWFLEVGRGLVEKSVEKCGCAGACRADSEQVSAEGVTP
jgi:hypothetical protein